MKRPRLLAALACLALLLAAPLGARPALWTVKDADTTIYLFGTVHLLPHDADWHYPALDQALAASRALYIELTDDGQANMTALVLRYGLDPSHPLSAQLSQADQGRLARAAQLANVPGGSGALNIMRPWLAALTLAVAPLTQAGLDPALGVDKQLRAAAEKAGKPVEGLESAEQQIRFLADMPSALQLALLRATLHDTDRAKVELKALIEAWKRGDDAAIARLENDTLRKEEPQLYQRLLVTRNEDWARRIKAMLDRPGTVFIAVGAAHLAGPDSVQAQLGKLGVAATREQAP
ncbi:TraB/GumN family protein [Frateuria defendens]|uniref:TraB/GumN family protein n=1 Tax=Frateuria defendens TaxID=2219559 RepID=UPI00066FBE75|nr:TraB/GumN family protein [Frateuria defendens]